MTLKEHLASLSADQKKALAEAAETEVIYLIQIAGGHSSPSPKLAKRIEEATNGIVTRAELRPDVFGEAAA
jgi:DNA-binding transcriptional regulator YdaS (Cro superfamily)